MAITTFQGPVRSLNGFISQGPGNAVTIAANTTLDPSYAGKVLTLTNATATITLPAVNVTADPISAGPGSDPNTQSNLGVVYTIFIGSTVSAAKIATNGTDKYVGSLVVGKDGVILAGGTATFVPGATNDNINLNGTTTGGIAGSYLTVQAVAANTYLVQGTLIGSGTLATPFADS